MQRVCASLFLALALLLGGHAWVSRASSPPQAPLVLWVERHSGENWLMSAPANALEAPRRLSLLPGGSVVEGALEPQGQRLALVTAETQRETLWLFDLRTHHIQMITQTRALDSLQWQANGLAYRLYQPAAAPQSGKQSTALQSTWQPVAHWMGTGQPAPHSELQASGDSLYWVAPRGRVRQRIARATAGFSALWQPHYGEVLFTRLEGRHTRLLRLRPPYGYAQEIARLPAGNWRLLDRLGDWIAAEWYPHGVQIFSPGRESLQALGEARHFLGFWSPQGNGSPHKGSPYPLLGGAESPQGAASSCPAPPAGCPVTRAYGYQPQRVEMGTTFLQAAQNALGSAAPTYDGIFAGQPPVRQTVSAQRPLPQVTLRSIAWQESVWLQYLASAPPYDGNNGCTLVSFDCGYGLMQVTSCMSGGCGWLSPRRVAAELPYNLGAGTNILIQKWNSVPYLGENDPTDAAEWYYAVLAYNGWSSLNDPNNLTRFDPLRPPFRESSASYRYPYQEKVYGWMAHPPHVGGEALWRPTDVPPVPRGIFGLRSADSWTPPADTPRPLTYLFHDVHVAPSRALTLWVENTTPYTLALDVLFYNADDTFNRRYLPPSAQPPWFVEPYLRLAPSSTYSLPLRNAFYTETFRGYLRAYASQGLRLRLQTPATPTLYLPLVLRETYTRTQPRLRCSQVLTNGGFESFADGRPLGWQERSAQGYALAGSTWFWQGHSGGYLGGYNNALDTLTQSLNLPAETLSLTLRLAWDVKSEALTPTLTGDVFTATLVDAAGVPIGAPWVLHERDAPAAWQVQEVVWPLDGGLPAALVFTARTDDHDPSAFFVDEVQLEACRAQPAGY